jgi:hypothetical protein
VKTKVALFIIFGALFAGVGAGVLLSGMIPILTNEEYRWIVILLTMLSSASLIFGSNKLKGDKANKE